MLAKIIVDHVHADGIMQCFVWRMVEEAVSHCLAAICDLAN